MDDGETLEGNDLEAAKPQQWWDVGEYRYDLASGGSSRGRRGLRGSTAGHGRQMQALQLVMVLSA
jgi:hypothetical protein